MLYFLAFWHTISGHHLQWKWYDSCQQSHWKLHIFHDNSIYLLLLPWGWGWCDRIDCIGKLPMSLMKSRVSGQALPIGCSKALSSQFPGGRVAKWPWGWDLLLYLGEKRGNMLLTSHLLVLVWEIWQSRELRRCSLVLHRMWQCDGAWPSRSQVSLYHVLWDRGAPQVNGLSAAIFLSSSQS